MQYPTVTSNLGNFAFCLGGHVCAATQPYVLVCEERQNEPDDDKIKIYKLLEEFHLSDGRTTHIISILEIAGWNSVVSHSLRFEDEAVSFALNIIETRWKWVLVTDIPLASFHSQTATVREFNVFFVGS